MIDQKPLPCPAFPATLSMSSGCIHSPRASHKKQVIWREGFLHMLYMFMWWKTWKWAKNGGRKLPTILILLDAQTKRLIPVRYWRGEVVEMLSANKEVCYETWSEKVRSPNSRVGWEMHYFAHPRASMFHKRQKRAKIAKLTWGSRQALGAGVCAGSFPKTINIYCL